MPYTVEQKLARLKCRRQHPAACNYGCVPVLAAEDQPEDPADSAAEKIEQREDQIRELRNKIKDFGDDASKKSEVDKAKEDIRHLTEQNRLDRPNGKETSMNMHQLARVASNVATRQLAAPKDEDAYQWLEFTGTKLNMVSKQGVKTALLPGDQFGVRKSGDGKQIRMVLKKLGVNKVFTLPLSVAQHIAKTCTPVGGVRKNTRNAGELRIDTKQNKADQKREAERQAQEEHLAWVVEEFFPELSKYASVALKTARKAGINYNVVVYLRKLADLFTGLDKKRDFYPDDIKARPVLEKFLAEFERAAMSNLGGRLVKPYDSKMQRLAAITFKNAFEFCEDDVINSIDDNDGFDMAAMYLGDLADHVNIACALMERNIPKLEKVTHLDTASRDMIPDQVWDWIQDNAR